MSRRLLMLACSASKSRQISAIPALDRYTGPLWQTLKATDSAGRLAFASVLSAHIGWKPASTLVASYERRLTPARARELLDGGISHGWPVQMRGGFEVPGAPNACSWLASTAGRRWDGQYSRPFTEVCIVGGSDYVRVGVGLVEEACVKGYLTRDCVVTIINDQIGYMRQALRSWLLRGAETCAASDARPTVGARS
jgi:hypothetical protein